MICPIPIVTADHSSTTKNTSGLDFNCVFQTSFWNFNTICKLKNYYHKAITKCLLIPNRRRTFYPYERVIVIVFVTHVTYSAQIYVLTGRTLPSHSRDSMFFTIAARNIRMSDADGCVVENSQVKGILVADTIVGP